MLLETLPNAGYVSPARVDLKNAFRQQELWRHGFLYEPNVPFVIGLTSSTSSYLPKYRIIVTSVRYLIQMPLNLELYAGRGRANTGFLHGICLLYIWQSRTFPLRLQAVGAVPQSQPSKPELSRSAVFP